MIGAIMAAYYAGLALGGLLGKRVILGFGHIRAFAAFAAVAATTALAYPLAFLPVVWLVLRFVNGFCIAGLTATIESWLNARSSNTARGRVLGLYMVTYYLAIASGQVLVNVTDIAGPELFMLAAAMLTLSLVPVSLSRAGAPALDGNRSLSVRKLHALSPVGVVGAGVSPSLTSPRSPPGSTRAWNAIRRRRPHELDGAHRRCGGHDGALAGMPGAPAEPDMRPHPRAASTFAMRTRRCRIREMTMTRFPYVPEIATGSRLSIGTLRIGVAATGGAADPAELMENAGMVLPARSRAGRGYRASIDVTSRRPASAGPSSASSASEELTT